MHSSRQLGRDSTSHIDPPGNDRGNPLTGGMKITIAPVWRWIAFGALIAYALSDLLIFHGPLRRRFDLSDPASHSSLERSRQQGVVARVGEKEITRSQLERKAREILTTSGTALESLSASERSAANKNAFEELALELLLDSEIPPDGSSKDLERRLADFKLKFESEESMGHVMRDQGIRSDVSLKKRIHLLLQRENRIASMLAGKSTVSEESAMAWFEKHRSLLANPARIRARHLFIPTLDHPSEEAKAKLETALGSLNDKSKKFEDLALEVSEDPATREIGGDLGWMTYDRLPADFGSPVFAMEIDKPALVRTKLGWHVVEVMERKSNEAPSFERSRSEILEALRAIQIKTGLQELKKAVLSQHAASVKILDPGLK